MNGVDTFTCDLHHPVMDIIANPTRREILRLIATETNYGNRIASILGQSTPGIHRHIKKMVGSVIDSKIRTHESFSGHKGAEATIYKIISRTGLFFGIFPHYVHSQVLEVDEDGNIIEQDLDPRNFDPELFGIKFQNVESDHKECSNESDDACLYQQFKKVQKINKLIRSQQERLMKFLQAKDKILEQTFETLEQTKSLTFEERVVLKHLITYGLNNLKGISDLLSRSEHETANIILSLKSKGWIVDKEIEQLLIE